MRAKYRRAQAHARVSLLRRSLRALYSYLNSLPHKRPLAFVKSSTATILDRVAVRARAAPLLPAASAHSRFSPPPLPDRKQSRAGTRQVLHPICRWRRRGASRALVDPADFEGEQPRTGSAPSIAAQLSDGRVGSG